MTTEELNDIEADLGILLPSNYRNWALQLPPVGQETKFWHWVFNDNRTIIDTNHLLRRYGCQEQCWPTELFCIGEADGNHYFISIDEPGQIYYTNHDDGPYFDSGSWKQCAYKSGVEFYADV